MFWRLLTKIAVSGSGSISQRFGSADPDPYLNFMDSQVATLFYSILFLKGSLHWKLTCFRRGRGILRLVRQRQRIRLLILDSTIHENMQTSSKDNVTDRCDIAAVVSNLSLEDINTKRVFLIHCWCTTLIKKKRKFSSGNSDGSCCTVIDEEGLPYIWGNAQIFSHIWRGH
jgi:hypothetical protein